MNVPGDGLASTEVDGGVEGAVCIGVGSGFDVVDRELLKDVLTGVGTSEVAVVDMVGECARSAQPGISSGLGGRRELRTHQYGRDLPDLPLSTRCPRCCRRRTAELYKAMKMWNGIPCAKKAICCPAFLVKCIEQAAKPRY